MMRRVPRWARARAGAWSSSSPSIGWSATSRRSIVTCSQEPADPRRNVWGRMLPMPRVSRLIIVAIAVLHAAAFIVYQRPDWDTLWTDQNGYLRLGHVLAETGRFTRFPDRQPFVPEAIR